MAPVLGLLVSAAITIIFFRGGDNGNIAVDNLTRTQAAIVGLNERGEALGFAFVAPGEHRTVDISWSDKPDTIEVWYDAHPGKDGYPEIDTIGFVLSC